MIKEIWNSIKHKYRMMKMKAQLFWNARKIAEEITNDIVYDQDENNEKGGKDKKDGKEKEGTER